MLGFLAFFKYSPVQSWILSLAGTEGMSPANMLRMIGVSYFSFRMIHFLVEAYRKKIQVLDLLAYIDYIIFFPAFISGPINRYNHFAAQICSPTKTGLAADLPGRRGTDRPRTFQEVRFGADPVSPYLSTQTEVLSGMGFLDAMLGLYAYAFYFYSTSPGTRIWPSAAPA